MQIIFVVLHNWCSDCGNFVGGSIISIWQTRGCAEAEVARLRTTKPLLQFGESYSIEEHDLQRAPV